MWWRVFASPISVLYTEFSYKLLTMHTWDLTPYGLFEVK